MSGAGTYRFIYSNVSPDRPQEGTGGLSHVITPSGIYRAFSSFTSVGVKRFNLAPWSDATGPFIYDWETRIQPRVNSYPGGEEGTPLARFTWPSGRRINVLNAKRLIVYDNTRIHWSAGPPGGVEYAPLVSLHDVGVEFRLEETREYRMGRLTTAVHGKLSLAGTKHVRPEIGGLLSFSHEYEYDSSFQVSAISKY